MKKLVVFVEEDHGCGKLAFGLESERSSKGLGRLNLADGLEHVVHLFQRRSLSER